MGARIAVAVFLIDSPVLPAVGLALFLAGLVVLGIMVRVRTLRLEKEARKLQAEIAERARVEKALRDSEQKFAMAFLSCPDPMTITALPDGRIVEANESFEQLAGFRRDEAIGRTTLDLEVWQEPRDRERMVRELEAHGRVRNLECVFRSRSGERIVALVSAERVEIGGEPCLIATSKIITERKRAEEALREERDRARRYLDIAGVLFVALDPRGTVTLINRKGCEVLGHGPDGILGRDWFATFIPEAAREETRRTFESLLAGRIEPAEFYRNPVLAADGQERLIEWHNTILRNEAGEVTGTLSSGQDVTERTRAEEALQRAAERIETLHLVDQAILAAQSPEAVAQAALRHAHEFIPSLRWSVVEFDHEAGEALVLAVHTRGTTQLGLGRRFPISAFQDVEGLRRGEPTVIEDFARLQAPHAVDQALMAEGVRSVINVPLISEGELIGTLNLALDAPGPFVPEHIEVAREMAAPLAIAIRQARLHQQVARHAAELEQRVSERTTELEAFTYSVSHDLRAPLCAMQGLAEALLDDYADRLDDQGKDYARSIAEAASRMDTLIIDLLTYSRISRTEMEQGPVDLGEIVVEALAQVGAGVRARDARVEVQGPLPRVIGHRATLVQVVANLLANAAKFVAAGVRPEVRVRAEVGDRLVRLWVEDNGIGIAPADHERVFHVFERLHGADLYPGTGIGLAIVRKGVERMGGRLGVESGLGQGSRFWIELDRGQTLN